MLRRVILTRRQKELLDYLDGHIRRRGYAPTLAEICTRFGLTSVATAHKHLANLERKGAIRRHAHRSRAVEVLPAHRRAATIELPLLGRVAAGIPIEAVETSDTIAVPEEISRGRAAFVLKVQGDSMIDEGILDGDYIVVDGRPTATNGDTVVAVIDGGATVKKFFRERGRVRLQPANAAQAPIVVRDREVTLRGVVVGLLRKY
jgi:repressor LexA